MPIEKIMIFDMIKRKYILNFMELIFIFGISSSFFNFFSNRFLIETMTYVSD
ncbi:MAG: hypothetical protein M1276_05260 [Deltaproteobacteria bacterium]|nr:hypothetical protein [Deltaproteobacteria bacterium]MDA8158664.1 hypothetical protein [Deltaproteobacteria bacterium]